MVHKHLIIKLVAFDRVLTVSAEANILCNAAALVGLPVCCWEDLRCSVSNIKRTHPIFSMTSVTTSISIEYLLPNSSFIKELFTGMCKQFSVKCVSESVSAHFGAFHWCAWECSSCVCERFSLVCVWGFYYSEWASPVSYVWMCVSLVFMSISVVYAGA